MLVIQVYKRRIVAQNWKKTSAEIVPHAAYLVTTRLSSGCVMTWQTNILEAIEMHFNFCTCSIQMTVQSYICALYVLLYCCVRMTVQDRKMLTTVLGLRSL
jgi:hypothetical protein